MHCVKLQASRTFCTQVEFLFVKGFRWDNFRLNVLGMSGVILALCRSTDSAGDSLIPIDSQLPATQENKREIMKACDINVQYPSGEYRRPVSVVLSILENLSLKRRGTMNTLLLVNLHMGEITESRLDTTIYTTLFGTDRIANQDFPE